MTRPSYVRLILIPAIAVAVTASLAAQSQRPPTPAKTPATASIASLTALLPAQNGWTRTRINSDLVEVSDTCSYTFAEGVYMNAAMKMRVTIADTLQDPAALSALATEVVTLPDGYLATPAAGVTLKRTAFSGFPAAERWDGVKFEGEVTVVVDNRFIVKAEGTGVDAIETVRAFVAAVDFKALAQLK